MQILLAFLLLFLKIMVLAYLRHHILAQLAKFFYKLHLVDQ